MKLPGRGLTLAQHNKLDAIADEDPEARVVDYVDAEDCLVPVLRRGDGRSQKLNPLGRLTIYRVKG